MSHTNNIFELSTHEPVGRNLSKTFYYYFFKFVNEKQL